LKATERIGMPKKKLMRLIAISVNPGHRKDAIGKNLLRLARQQKSARKKGRS